ncbi:hypothetical protein [Clostridium saccharoperbutylacetonicum]
MSEGWVEETVQGNSFWYYYDSNGDRVTDWIKWEGDWYYCYSDGTMAKDTVVDGCYVNNNGKWTKDERSREVIDGNDDHFWYYIGPYGKAVTGWNKIGENFHYYNSPGGSMTRNNTIDGFDIDDYGNIDGGTGWLRDEYSGKWYYYLKGSMQTGWVQENNGIWYFLKSDGSMATGWQQVKGFWYYLQSDGSMASKKWVNDGTGWYYLYENGSMARGTTANGYYVDQENGKMVTGAGWQHKDNKYFYLNSDDSVGTGWIKDKNLWYYFYPENSDSHYQGEMAEDTIINGWKVDNSGKWVENYKAGDDSQKTSDSETDTLMACDTGDRNVDIAFTKWYATIIPGKKYADDPRYSITSVAAFQNRLLYISEQGEDVSELSADELDKLFELEMDDQANATLGMSGAADIIGSNSAKIAASEAAYKGLSNAEILAKFAKENGIDNLALSYEEILKFSGGRMDLAKKLILATKEAIGGKTIPELVDIFKLPSNPEAASLSIYQTRIWYKWQESLIGSKLDYSKALEEVARDAFEMRNTIRTQARESMLDQDWAEFLMQNEKNITFEQLVKRNMDKGLSGDALWNKIIQSSMSSRDSVNSLFQLD